LSPGAEVLPRFWYFRSATTTKFYSGYELAFVEVRFLHCVASPGIKKSLPGTVAVFSTCNRYCYDFDEEPLGILPRTQYSTQRKGAHFRDEEVVGFCMATTSHFFRGLQKSIFIILNKYRCTVNWFSIKIDESYKYLPVI
jgi:hypothetical protein